ncbi:terminase small subunit [Rhizobium leguminosarum]|uniref:terminase small subunit n=1 Tax=Rhizobium leguminosarum TaxID=384 RepID=UPI001C974C56|nr:terminase small subunit [Rhizobium leguminosarum]MBY5329571.1 terminase small subunit [Rhizobium leguminosarum]
MTSDEEILDEPWSPPAVDGDDDLDPSLAQREAPAARLVSLKQCALLLGRNRTTVEKWLGEGCPSVTKANRDLGVAWTLDLAEVVKWLERSAAERTADRFGNTDGGEISEGDAKRRRLVALMYQDEAEAARTLRSQVVWQLAIDAMETVLTEVRGGVAAIPDAVAGKVEPKHAVKIRKAVDETIRQILDAVSISNVVSKIPVGD